jgi:transposase InsO family protein
MDPSATQAAAIIPPAGASATTASVKAHHSWAPAGRRRGVARGKWCDSSGVTVMGLGCAGLMRLMGLAAIYQHPRTTVPQPDHSVHPYLLQGLLTIGPIFNTDQGSQFTSPQFTRIPTDAAVNISMDGRGRWMDNVFIERLWRSLKYECVYLHAFDRLGTARQVGAMDRLLPMPGALTPAWRTNPESPTLREMVRMTTP